MEAVYELRLRFGEDDIDIVASEYNEEMLQLQQGEDIVWFPKKNAGAFAEALMTWIATGGKEAI